MNEHNDTQEQLFGSNDPDPETIETGKEFREVLQTLVEDGSENVTETMFQERAGALVDAIFSEDDEMSGDVRDLDNYSSRATGEQVDNLTNYFETTIEATVNRSWILSIIEGYEARGTDLNVNHERVLELLDNFIETEEDIPERRRDGRDAMDDIESDISNPRSPFVEGSDRSDALSQDQQQSSERSNRDSEVALDIVDRPDELIPVGAVIVLPVSFRTRRERDQQTDGTLSVSLSEPLYGGFVDFDPTAEQPVSPDVEPTLREAVEGQSPTNPVGAGDTDAERTVNIDRDRDVVGLAVYVDDVGVEEIDITVESDATDITRAEQSILLQVQTEDFIEARADALDQSLPWYLIGGGGVAAAGAMAGGYLLYNKMSSDTQTE